MRISDWSSDVCSSDLGDDVDRRDSGGRGQGLWHRTPELRKRHSARSDAVRGRRHLSGWKRLSRKAAGSRYDLDRKSTRLNSSHSCPSRMPSSACKKKRAGRIYTNSKVKRHNEKTK